MRSRDLGQGKRIKKETLIQAIKEKYGKPTTEYFKKPFTEIIWEFDQNGSLNSEEQCRLRGLTEDYLNIRFLDASKVDLEEATCSRRYYSYMKEDSDTGMISEFGVRLVDVNLMLEERRQAESEKQKAIEQEAKTNKPKL